MTKQHHEFEKSNSQTKAQNAVQTIPTGRYRHFKGMEYEVIGVARHSENLEPFVVYRALYGDHGLWVRPLSMFTEKINRDGYDGPRFTLIQADS